MENNFEKYSFFNVEVIEDKKNDIKEKLKNITEDLSEKKLIPIKLFQRNNVIDLTVKKKHKAVFKGPFIVLEVKKTDKNKKFLYKGQIKDNVPFRDIRKEEIMYRDILPEIYKNFPKNIKRKVVFPKLIEGVNSKTKIKSIVRKKIEGVICGTHDATKKNIWDKKDVEAICYVIKEFQNINQAKIKKNFPELLERNFIEFYKNKFEKYAEPVKNLLSEKYAGKMKKLLQKDEKIISKQPSVLLSEDIFCFNIIKMPDERLGFIDWERPHIGKDISADYGKFISRLWTNPRLQEEAIKITLKINQENSYFKDMLRASLVFLEGGYSFHYYFKRLENDNPQVRKEAKKAVGVFKKLFKDILDNKGIWQEKN